jgi:VWFA-related protein
MKRVLNFAGSSLLLFLFSVSHSSSANGPVQRGTVPSVPVSAAQANEMPQQTNSIRIQSNEVVAAVSVTDSSGEVVLDLSQKEFHIFDNRVEQKIVHWDLGGDPLAVGLVIETSSHIRAMIPVIHSLGSIFTETVMALNGEAAVITYGDAVKVIQPFTQDHDAVEKSIATTEFSAPEIRLYDGMAKAVSLLKSQPLTFRRIMLVVGESQDDSSETNLGQILRDAVAANIMIYGVGLSSTTADLRGGTVGRPDGKKLYVKPSRHLPAISTVGPGADPMGRPYYDVMTPAIWLLTRGTNKITDHQLEVAAAGTGGIHYGTLRDGTIRTALDRIGGELHAQYILSYVPTNEAPGFHKINVTVARSDVSVRTRPGYFRNNTR